MIECTTYFFPPIIGFADVPVQQQKIVLQSVGGWQKENSLLKANPRFELKPSLSRLSGYGNTLSIFTCTWLKASLSESHALVFPKGNY